MIYSQNARRLLGWAEAGGAIAFVAGVILAVDGQSLIGLALLVLGGVTFAGARVARVSVRRILEQVGGVGLFAGGAGVLLFGWLSFSNLVSTVRVPGAELWLAVSFVAFGAGIASLMALPKG